MADADGQTVLILTAMRPEARAVARALGLRRQGEGYVGVGTRGVPVRLELVGIGAGGYRRSAGSVSRVILAGLAGGLDPSLKTGDLVVDLARIHTVGKLICTPGEKAALFAATGAACVDMETQVVRRLVEDQGVAFAAVRVILDAANQELPGYLLALTDSNGQVRVGAVLRLIVRRPAAMAKLIRWGLTTRRALRALGEAVRGVVEG